MQNGIVWFRNDLRLADNPALSAAIKSSDHILPLYIHCPDQAGHWAHGEASHWWLDKSLAQLDTRLHERGNHLRIYQGPALEILLALCRQYEINHIHANRVYEPALRQRDTALTRQLAQQGIHLQLHHGCTLLAPEAVLKKDGQPYRMFTPYWKVLSQQYLPTPPRAAPDKIPDVSSNPHEDFAIALQPSTLAALQLAPATPWDEGFHGCWQAGETQALRQLQKFQTEGLHDYAQGRDLPDRDGTSRLSPYLHFGEISPGQIFWALHTAAEQGEVSDTQAEAYRREIGWREFAYSVLYHFPHTCDQAMDARFNAFPWNKHPQSLLRAWQLGQTGIPIVDAGMRQLWTTGWMHNRVRMIVASFLTKNCLIDWREGARWFWDTLVDADLANNSLGWQWTAGCGVDAAPYFRIFNPVRQGEKFDPQGHYVKTWLPELSQLDKKYIHQPWNAGIELLRKAGVILDGNYPHPVVDLAQSREAALAAFASTR